MEPGPHSFFYSFGHSTQVKSKNMQRDIEVKNNIIEDQRSNLMELQLHSEHLSQSLFQERQERELVNSK